MTKEEILKNYLTGPDGDYSTVIRSIIRVPEHVATGSIQTLREYIIHKLNAAHSELSTKIFDEIRRLL